LLHDTLTSSAFGNSIPILGTNSSALVATPEMLELKASEFTNSHTVLLC